MSLLQMLGESSKSRPSQPNSSSNLLLFLILRELWTLSSGGGELSISVCLLLSAVSKIRPADMVQ